MDTIEDSTIIEFSNLMRRVRKLGLNAAGSDDRQVSPAQSAFLEWIAANPGAGVQNIASGLRLSAPTVSVGVKKLEDNGLIERAANPSDARSVQFHLTEKGQQVHQQDQRFLHEKFRLLLSGLAAKDQIILIDLLTRALDQAEGQN